MILTKPDTYGITFQLKKKLINNVFKFHRTGEMSELNIRSSDGIKNFQSQKGNFICHSCNANLTTLIPRKCQNEEGSPSTLLW